MKFTFNVSPNLRQRQSTKRIMFELMLGLAAVYLFALVYYYTAYGMRYALQALLLLNLAAASVSIASARSVTSSYRMTNKPCGSVESR